MKQDPNLRRLATVVRLLFLGLPLLALAFASAANATQASSPHIRIDAFGYEAFESKAAVLRTPVVGFDAPDAFAPGATVLLVDDASNSTVYAAPPVPWGGAGSPVHPTSGDRAWSFDFSSVTQPGTYRVVDPQSGES
ncbi:MAG: cellulase N-terminal Ig-like domain-containing protein, partial [Planctomycetota bacterium]